MKMSTKRLRRLVREELARSTRLLQEDEEVQAVAAAEAETAAEAELTTDLDDVVAPAMDDRQILQMVRAFYKEAPGIERGSPDNPTATTPGRVILTTSEFQVDQADVDPRAHVEDILHYVVVHAYQLLPDGAGGVQQGPEMREVSDSMEGGFLDDRDYPGTQMAARRAREYLGDDWEDLWRAVVDARQPLSVDIDAMAITDPERWKEMMTRVWDSPLLRAVHTGPGLLKK